MMSLEHIPEKHVVDRFKRADENPLKQDTCDSDPSFEQDCKRERGRLLVGKYAHYCFDWDGLTVDESTLEFQCCQCFSGIRFKITRWLSEIVVGFRFRLQQARLRRQYEDPNYPDDNR